MSIGTIALLKSPVLKEPKWSKLDPKPGEEVTLSVTAEDLTGQKVFHEIRNADDQLMAVLEADGSYKSKWIAPATAVTAGIKYTFFALLRDTPTAANGHIGLLSRVKCPDLLEVKGTLLKDISVDACFVPKQEKFAVKFKLEGSKPAKGRYEIWGERYPTKKPIYTETFVPADGDNTWDTWYGGKDPNAAKGAISEAGPLKGKYLSPEFAPYRVRIVVGPDDESVADPRGKGLGKVALAEAQFEITFLSVVVRLQANLAGPLQTNLDKILAVEPRTTKGKYAVVGRLPLETEPKVNAGWATGEGEVAERPGVGRILIPCVRHTGDGEPLSQNGKLIADGYTKGGGPDKYSIDSGVYSRPELPLEIEAHLKSKDPEKNKAPDKGIFEKSAIGPAIYELDSEDAYRESLFTTGEAAAQSYFRNAASKVKRGKHDDPYDPGGADPEITYWMARLTVQNNGDAVFNTTTSWKAADLADAAFLWAAGEAKDEITVYLNFRKLTFAENDDQFDKQKREYKVETDTTTIRLQPGLTKANDLIWILRCPKNATGTWAVDNWNRAPGVNCHENYGGIRGEVSTDDIVNVFRKAYSSAPTGTEPIVGKGTAAFPYTAEKGINLDPFKITTASKRERVESQAVTKAGDQLGLAGIIFSPSYIAGDGYVIQARLRGCPYARDYGFETVRPDQPWVVGKTGQINVWRAAIISKSLYGGGIVDPAYAGRTHAGDGTGMNVARLNTLCEPSFNEWSVTEATPGSTAHVQVLDTDYVNAINGLTSTGDGAVTLTAGDINDQFIRWDHFRVRMPPGIPAHATDPKQSRTRAASNAIGALPAISSSLDAAQAVYSSMMSLGALGVGDDEALTSTEVPVFSGSAAQYKNWVANCVNHYNQQLLNALIGRESPPRSMRTIRWPNGYQQFWVSGNPPDATELGTAGAVQGDGQSFFYTVGGNPDTFEHEMGHAVHLFHFSSGNCEWKHHDHGYVTCIMSYYSGDNHILSTGAAMKGTWPDTNGSGTASIRLFTNGNRDEFCAKCSLKMRGWNDEKLPCNWEHPDLY